MRDLYARHKGTLCSVARFYSLAAVSFPCRAQHAKPENCHHYQPPGCAGVRVRRPETRLYSHLGNADILLPLCSIRKYFKCNLGGDLHGSPIQNHPRKHHVVNDIHGQAICIAVCPKRCPQGAMGRSKIYPRMSLYQPNVGVSYVYIGRAFNPAAKLIAKLAGVGIF